MSLTQAVANDYQAPLSNKKYRFHIGNYQYTVVIKMVQALDREKPTTILKDVIEQTELKDKVD